MHDLNWLNQQAQISLQRLLPRIEPLLRASEAEPFLARLRQHFPTVFRLFYELYGDHYDFFYFLEQILISTADMYTSRPADLKTLDHQREAEPLWFHSEKMVGGVGYVDLFAGNLDGLRAKIPYLKELGLTYLHLMPLFKAPEEDSDGGYAISDYRTIDPKLGTVEHLADLARELRSQGISLVLDFVFNHTSNEHWWALKALDGDDEYQNYYYMFADRTLPDQYERTLREIFPEQAPGSFTYQPRIFKWVWTTFRRFQWDLNYRNPAVFNAMLQEMLFLANQGVEVLRLDAVAFIWKEMGTSCESLPQAHLIIQAFNALVRIAAPALLFKSEAIVHPADVAAYVKWEECPISYNPTLMALLWESLATRDVKLLRQSMIRRFWLPPDCAWVNYIRVHDDIGWTFANEDAGEMGINGFDHRQFLNTFYTGRFPGSFAKGLPFNFNPATLDMRISGTAASLAGVEQALSEENPLYLEHALARLLLIHSVILSAGGIPLLYLGDEIATINDYRYGDDPGKQNDSRWVHRPPFDWERATRRNDSTTNEGRLFQGLARLIQLRKQTPALAGGSTRWFDPGNTHVLAYSRNDRVLIVANFTEHRQVITRAALLAHMPDLPEQAVDRVTGQCVNTGIDLVLEPYQFMWLAVQEG